MFKEMEIFTKPLKKMINLIKLNLKESLLEYLDFTIIKYLTLSVSIIYKNQILYRLMFSRFLHFSVSLII